MKKEEELIDICNICGWSGTKIIQRNSPERGITWHCPKCDSEDLEDINFNPYDEEEDGEGIV
jgi:predicted Zn-ribbon and HTH transcriptional regulator